MWNHTRVRHSLPERILDIDDDERTGLLRIIIPSAEAISAVDISTNNFEAELWRATGAVTNVTLKSRSNQFVLPLPSLTRQLAQ